MEACLEALEGGSVKAGEVIVRRYEGARGGPIALVRNGDQIEVDIPGRRLSLLIPAMEHLCPWAMQSTAAPRMVT